MKAERGLVEHVERVDQARAQGLGQADALELARREQAAAERSSVR